MQRHAILLPGDCLERFAEIPDDSVDAILTDPPYGLSPLTPAQIETVTSAWASGDRSAKPVGQGFMGKSWDASVPPPAVWDECFRVLKPGGFLLTFAGTRTVDLMTYSVRLSGLEIRPVISWLYGSGFPKSMDVSKAIDKESGAQRQVIATGKPVKRMIPGADQGKNSSWIKDNGRTFTPTVTEPATDEAQKWCGWGTCLKPAHEPIIVARKPGAPEPETQLAETGGFPAFRYQKKATPKERPQYTDAFGKQVMHPTVKPLDLIRWLVRLVTPAGGLVLDPFAGSGTTMEAAALEGFDSVSMELTGEYIPLIAQRAQRSGVALTVQQVPVHIPQHEHI